MVFPEERNLYYYIGEEKIIKEIKFSHKESLFTYQMVYPMNQFKLGIAINNIVIHVVLIFAIHQNQLIRFHMSEIRSKKVYSILSPFSPETQSNFFIPNMINKSYPQS